MEQNGVCLQHLKEKPSTFKSLTPCNLNNCTRRYIRCLHGHWADLQLKCKCNGDDFLQGCEGILREHLWSGWSYIHRYKTYVDLLIVLTWYNTSWHTLSLVVCFSDEKHMVKCPDRLRLPLLFYFGHTATLYVNKMVLAGLIKVSERVHSVMISVTCHILFMSCTVVIWYLF